MSQTPFSTHVSNVRAAVLARDSYPEFRTPGRLERTKAAVDMLAARLLAAGSALPEEKGRHHRVGGALPHGDGIGVPAAEG
ncbi:hypothetical protein B1A87_007690 [Arthrobacter sp. KBS0703]|uniref:hypothetical protein n=1 Tax=Arthrobacter sp. KBS0703 TaxID=1955698 RepID=UPI00098F84E7|nr:hypothetical protein [Arthrobacter sp. KBS0703]TSE15798.1 hypothetical protein B1A87_007690 [Arthrobacter sp. KBS0703]